jgi:hydrogenase maturation protease
MLTAQKEKVLILGIGSPFADDQFGWLVTDILVDILKDFPYITVETLDRPGLNLLQYFTLSYSKIILIDAVYTGKCLPGTPFYFPASKVLEAPDAVSSHNLGVASSLQLAKALGIDITHIEIYGVEINRSSKLDQEVSHPVKTQAPLIAKNILEKLGESLKTHA